MRRKRNPDAKLCGAVKEDGSSCQAFSVPGTDRCPWHTGDAAERSERARRAAEIGALKRHLAAERPAPFLRPEIPAEQVYSVLADALTATFETGEPDYSARLAACAVLVLSQPKVYRRTPAEITALLEQLIPVTVWEEEEMREQATAAKVLKGLRDEWVSLPKWHPVRGLVVDPFPPGYVGDFENYAEVCRRELPPDVPPEEAPVEHFPDGTVALRRDDALMLKLERWEPPESPDLGD